MRRFVGRIAAIAASFFELQDVILAINLAGGVLLSALLIGNLARLAREYRGNVPGAKRKARMVGMEGFQLRQLFSGTDEFDRFAGDRLDGKRRTAASRFCALSRCAQSLPRT